MNQHQTRVLEKYSRELDEDKKRGKNQPDHSLYRSEQKQVAV